MKRTVLQSLVFSVVTAVLYIGIQIAVGYYKTLNYAPDIIHSYQSAEVMQHKIEFGYRMSPYGAVSEVAGILLLGMIVFIAGKLMFRKK